VIRLGWPIALLTALAAALRVPGLNRGLWFDEIVTLVTSVRQPLAELVSDFASNNVHPLYSVLAHAAIVTFGDDVWSLRLPALMFGVATVPLLYVLGREVATRDEAMAAAALQTVSYHHIWFSQNARGYTALAFFTMASTLLLLRALREGRTRDILSFAAVTALGAYTHLTMVLTAVAQAAVCAWAWSSPASAGLASRPRARIAFGFVLSAVLTVALYAPMLPAIYAFFTGPPQQTAEVATASWAVWETLRGLRIGMGAVGVALGGLLLAWGMASYWRDSRIVVGLFVLPGGLTMSAMAALGAPLRPRFVFFLIGFALLFVVRGVARLAASTVPHSEHARARPLRTLPGMIVTGLMLAGSMALLPANYRLPKQDYDGALRFIEHSRPADTAVVTAGLAMYPFRHFYGRDWPAVETVAQLRDVQQRAAAIWVVYAFPEYMEPALGEAIQRECPPLQVFPGTLGGGQIIVCAARAAHAR
jgi:4-amino-4-deoxy-L-arabinose transferase-like glycosyltransferase